MLTRAVNVSRDAQGRKVELLEGGAAIEAAIHVPQLGTLEAREVHRRQRRAAPEEIFQVFYTWQTAFGQPDPLKCRTPREHGDHAFEMWRTKRAEVKLPQGATAIEYAFGAGGIWRCDARQVDRCERGAAKEKARQALDLQKVETCEADPLQGLTVPEERANPLEVRGIEAR